MQNSALTDQERKDFALATIASLSAIRAENSNAILSSVMKNSGSDPDAAFVALVSSIVQLAN